MLQKFKFLVLVFAVVFFAGCSGNIFEGLESKGGSIEDKIYDAKLLLENAKTPADYANAAIQIKALMDTLPDGEQKRELQMDYATAKLGEAGIDMVTIANAIMSKTADTDKDDLAKIKDILNKAFEITNIDSSTNSTITSADYFNEAFLSLIAGLEDTLPKALTDAEINAKYKNQMLTAAIANACAAIFTILREFDTNKNGEIEGEDNLNDFDNRWNTIEGKVLKYVRNAIKFTLRAVAGAAEDIKKIEKAVDDLETKLDSTKNSNLRQDIIDNL